jgi:hypothetical protein
MFGTVNGFTGRFRMGTAPLMAIVGALLLFLLYRHAADIAALLPSFRTPEHIAEPVVQQAPAAPVVHPRPRAAKPEPPFRGVVTELDQEPAVASPPNSAPAAAPTPGVEPQAAPDPDNYLAPHENSPYDSKTKRAMRSVGRFLHVIPKEPMQDRN